MREVFPSDGWEQIGNEMVISQILRVQINALHVIGREITLQFWASQGFGSRLFFLLDMKRRLFMDKELEIGVKIKSVDVR